MNSGRDRHDDLHAHRLLSKGPLPLGDVLSIHAELESVIQAADLLIEQGFSNTRPCLPETGYPVNGVNGQAEAVCLVADSQLQGRIDVSLFLVAAHMNVMLPWPAVGQPVDQPWVRVEVEDHGFG